MVREQQGLNATLVDNRLKLAVLPALRACRDLPPPRKYSGDYFCEGLSKTQGYIEAGRIT